MKTKFKKNGRRILASVLCLVMAVMALPMSAFAWTSEEGVSCTSSFGEYYVGSDGEYYRSKSSYSFIVYDSDGNISVRTISAGNAKRKYLMTDDSGTHQVYCVESGIDFNTGNSYVSKNGKNSSYFRKLPTEAQFGVMMALMYGWHEGKSSPVAGTNTDDYAFATQTIIWEYQQQLRTSPSDLHSANGIDADTYRYSLKGRPAEKCYDWILSQMASHYTIPSFAARNQNKADTYTLKYNPDKQNYSLTLTDTNNTLANLSLSASGIKVSRSGNQYTFTSDKMITSPVTVSAQKAVNLDCDEKLRVHDWAIFNSDRRYYQRMQETGTYLDEVAADMTQPEIKTVEDFLDNIENQQLYQVLIKVDRLTLRIAFMKVQGYSTREIASYLRITEKAVYRRLDRLKEKIQKIFE